MKMKKHVHLAGQCTQRAAGVTPISYKLQLYTLKLITQDREYSLGLAYLFFSIFGDTPSKFALQHDF